MLKNIKNELYRGVAWYYVRKANNINDVVRKYLEKVDILHAKARYYIDKIEE